MADGRALVAGPEAVALQESLARVRDSRDVQLELCRPEVNPDWACYFATNFCYTSDDQRGGGAFLLPKWPVTLRWIRTLDWCDPDDPLVSVPPENILNDKSRKMVATWSDVAYFLGCLLMKKGWSGGATSKTQNYVDDSGHTVQSFFGRLKFMWEHLPSHLQRGISFSYMRAVCEDTGSSLIGEAPTINAFRAGALVRLYAGEISHVPHSEMMHGAMDEACPFGKVYESTAYGRNNVFARIKRERPKGWRIFEMDWKDHPVKGRGVRRETDLARVELYGPWTSDWFERAVAGKTPEQVAQELNRSEQKSVPGRVYPEFDRDIHVATERLEYDPSLPLVVSVDFGHARKTVAALMQPVQASRRMRIIAEYVGEHRKAPDNARGLIECIRGVGYDGALENLDVIPDPSALHEEQSGRSVWSWYRAAGFTSYAEPLITGPDSVDIGTTVVRTMVADDRLEVDPECVTIIEGFENYHRPVDRITGEVTSNKPEHDIYSHPMDAVRYGVTSVYDADDAEWDGIVQGRDVKHDVHEREERRDVPTEYEDYDARPIMSGFPERF